MTTPKTVNGVPLPTWTDAAAVQSYLTSLAATAFAVVTLVHPGYTEPAAVQSLVPSVSFLVAGVAQIVNIVWHRKATAAAVSAGVKVD